MKATQHESRFKSFLTIRKTYGSMKNEKTIGAHFFTPSLEGFQVSTRFQKTGKDEKTGEDMFKEVTGVFLDSLSATVASISILPPKALPSGKEIPESIALDLLGDDGKSLNRVTFVSDSKFGDHFLRKAPSADFTKEITLSPYAFYPEGKEEVSQGMNVIQNNTKLNDNYGDWKNVDGKNVLVNKNGLEQFDVDAKKAKEMPQGKLRSAEWKRYFALVNNFLVEELKKMPVFEANIETTTPETTADETTESVDALADELLGEEAKPF
jgi:hypothetical protein